MKKADIIHLSTVHVEVEGDINFPKIPENFNLVFEQFFLSNINYTYQIWKKYFYQSKIIHKKSKNILI